MALPIHYIDRQTKQEMIEKVYGQKLLDLFYGKSWLSKAIQSSFLPLIAKNSFFSALYGRIQKSRLSRRKIAPFIRAYGVDPLEFLDPVESFESFNDFFIRRLRPECRPIASGHDVAILPADARYLAFSSIASANGFWVKGVKFSLDQLLQDLNLADQYRNGALLTARLCPTDYHRFHFPVNCIPSQAKLINGPLYSVNPIALKHNISILTENKRMITHLQTKQFGTILYIEVGATHVGSIHQTFIPEERYAKGDEKGFFSFGGSMLLILFEPGKIQFDQDLIDASHRHLETRGLLGQSLGRALFSL